jgi:hypothetical protein
MTDAADIERAEHVLDDSMELAIARWQLEHPGATIPAPWSTLAGRWAGRGAQELDDAVSACARQLERLEGVPPADDRELMGVPLVHARLTLQSAASGDFSTAAGSLVDFLRAVGAAPLVIRVG